MRIYIIIYLIKFYELLEENCNILILLKSLLYTSNLNTN